MTTTDLTTTPPVVETMAVFKELQRPIHPGHIRQRRQGSIQVDYIPWWSVAKHLHHRCPEGWEWEIQSVDVVGDWVVAKGVLTIHTPERAFRYSGVSSEPLTSSSDKGAPPVETACSRALARAAATCGLAIDLYDTK